MQQTSARDGEKRRRHEDLVGGRVEDGAGARFAEPTRQHPVEEIRCGRRAHERELPLRLVHERKRDRKSTRLNSSHLVISYAVFCLKKKKNTTQLRSLVLH